MSNEKTINQYSHPNVSTATPVTQLMESGITGRIAIPFIRYSLRLHHPLLDALGRLSHFLLINLAEDGINLETIRKATGLTLNELYPVVQRLAHLKLLDDAEQLTATGLQMSKLLQLGLHGAQADIWFDYLGHRPMGFLVADKTVFLSDYSEAEFLLSPNQQNDKAHIKDKKHLSAHQQMLREESELASRLRQRIWADYGEWINVQDNRQGRSSEWSLTLDFPESDETQPAPYYWLPVHVPLQQPIKGSWLIPTSPSANNPHRLDMPVFQWSVSYAAPIGLPNATPVPTNVRLNACGVSGAMLDAGEHSDLINQSNNPAPSGWEVKPLTLVDCFEESTPDVAGRWSRTVAFTTRWRSGRIDPKALTKAALLQHAPALFELFPELSS